jgi:hypothetical protein
MGSDARNAAAAGTGTEAGEPAWRDIEIEIPYEPRDIFRPFHNRKQRWSIEVAHRRAGKTVARVNELIVRAMECELIEPHYAYVAPTFTQAKDVAWGYLKRFTLPFPDIETNEAELRADLPNGARIRLYGAENYDRMRGIYLDGVVMDEVGMIDPRAWPEVIRPALSDRRGWADFIGTPNGYNHFFDLWVTAAKDPDWFHAMHRASDTGILDAAELADARKTMTPEQYSQEYECSFAAAVIGSYYGREIAYLEGEKRIGRVPWEPATQVHTAWDLGIGDATAIWFAQFVGREVRIIDYLEHNGVGLAWYANELRQRPYAYGEHILPHDAEVKELGSGQSRIETLRTLGINNTRVIPAQRVEDGIQAVRNLLPRCWIDADKCARGLQALRQYRREYDDKRKVFQDRPLHDWASHAADAARYLALGQPKDRTAVKLVYSNKGIL